MKRWIICAAGAVAAANMLASGILAAGRAAVAATHVPGSTHKCTTGVYSGYCGTYTDMETPPMSMVSGGSAQQDRFVYAKPNSTTSPLRDFFWFRYQGGTSWIGEFAPNGVASNYCVAQTGRLSGLKLRQCSGSSFQRWTLVTFTNGDEIRNVATGNAVQSNGEDKQLRGVAVPMTPTDSQLWAFVG